MTSTSDTLVDRVRGCLLGGAIGDALAAPVENWHWTDVRRVHGRVDSFHPQPARHRDGAPGQVTDDSTLRHYLCLAIVEAGGRIGPPEYAAAWLRHLNPDRLYVTERLVLEKLRLGMSPWDTGRGQLAADAAIMSMAPVGIINVGDPRQAYQDGFVLAGLHQDLLERDAAAASAAGVAAALVPGATAREVVEAMATHAPYEVVRLVQAGIRLAATCSSVDQLAERFYATQLDRTFPTPPGTTWDPERSVAATSREVLPAVTAVLLLQPDDPAEAIIDAAALGRDADTIATVVGCLSGALHGASRLPADWVATIEEANTAFFTEVGGPGQGFTAMADLLVETVAGSRAGLRERLNLLDGLL